MARHFLDLDGAATVETDSLSLTRRAVRDLVRRRAMGVIHGPAGTGKTFAVEEALNELPPDWQALYLTSPTRPTMRLVAAEIHRELTGTRPARRLDRFELTHQLRAEFAVSARALVVDEAQNLNRECIDFLRFLGEDPMRRTATLLVGGDGCWEVLSREPMLRSRIYRRVTFAPLSGSQMIEAARRFHPLYENAPEDLLKQIDTYFGHGFFRHWGTFTSTALDLMADKDIVVLDTRVVRNVFALVAGGVNAS